MLQQRGMPVGARVALQCHAQQAARDGGCAHELARQCATLPQGLEGLPLGLLLCRQLRGGLQMGWGDGDEGGEMEMKKGLTLPQPSSPANLGPAFLTYPLPVPTSTPSQSGEGHLISLEP